MTSRVRVLAQKTWPRDFDNADARVTESGALIVETGGKQVAGYASGQWDWFTVEPTCPEPIDVMDEVYGVAV